MRMQIEHEKSCSLSFNDGPLSLFEPSYNYDAMRSGPPPPLPSDSYGWDDFPVFGYSVSEQSISPFSCITSPPSEIFSPEMNANSLTTQLAFMPEQCCENDGKEATLQVTKSQSSSAPLPPPPCSPRTSEIPRRRTKVQFSSVSIQEYAVTLGDHPFCRGSYPLTLDWCHTMSEEIHIDEFEASRRRISRKRTAPQNSNDGDCGAPTATTVQKLSNWERQERLRKVSGMKKAELFHLELQRLNCSWLR